MLSIKHFQQAIVSSRITSEWAKTTPQAEQAQQSSIFGHGLMHSLMNNMTKLFGNRQSHKNKTLWQFGKLSWMHFSLSG